MPNRSEAEDNLRVIRSLMERATIYRAVSAPVALVAGIVALLGCGFIAIKADPSASILTTDYARGQANNVLFLETWLTVLFITACANAYFLWRDAKRRSDVFLSPAMRAALRALLPGFLVAGALTVLQAKWSYQLPAIWMLFYGLSLLATQYFAPRSLIMLGWAFLLTGLVATVYFSMRYLPASIGINYLSHPYFIPNLAMGATFGLFHIVYAACTWPRKSIATAPGAEP